MIICVILAYYSEKYTDAVKQSGQTYSISNDIAFIMLAVILVLFAGLRKDYNDTWNYLDGFRQDQGLVLFLKNSKNLNIMANPLFNLFRSTLREFTDNAQLIIFIPSVFTQVFYLLFFKRYSSHFTFSIFIYFALGSFAFSLAALKQVWAMAVATLAFPYLEKKQWLKYYVIIFIAMLIHTYALAYALLPLFAQRPWKLFTYLFVAGLVFVMLNFEEAITAFMEQAEEAGKKVYEEDVFYDHGVNILRVAVYAVAPVISFFFQRWIFRNSSAANNVLVHMSIISFAFMLLGTQAGANMFARMAQYFELGTICCLPWMLEKTFEERSHRLIATLAVTCFLVYFGYSNLHFDAAFKMNSIFSLFGF